MNKTVPPTPNLDFDKKQAKSLHKAYRIADPSALNRIMRQMPQYQSAEAAVQANLKLSDMQFVVAREYGFASWPKLKQFIEMQRGRERHRPFETDIQYYADRAYGLWSVYQTGQQQSLDIIKRYHPDYVDATDEALIAADFTVTDARLVLAREHGFGSWEALMAYIEALAAGEVQEPFRAAFEALKERALDQLKQILDMEPELVHVQGTNGNTLLNLSISMRHLPAVELLLDAGADVNRGNNKGWTALHQAANLDPCYAETIPLIETLLAAGGDVTLEAHGAGGTPLIQALFWGHQANAERLAEVGIVPFNLRTAAGLGRVALVEAFFEEDGSLASEAFAAREFHRPHSGFPPWQPSNERQEVLDEALVWACKSGRLEVLPLLVEQGADVNADPYRGSGLLWAIWRGHTDVVRWLLDHGAEVNKTVTFGGTGHGDGVTAMHVVGQVGHVEIAELLLAHGGDVNPLDRLHRSTPLGWARWAGHADVVRIMAADPRRLSLINATQSGQTARVQEILTAGAEPIDGPAPDICPLRAAVHDGFTEIVRLLLEYGANPNIPHPEGMTALKYALENENGEIEALLREYGATD